MSLALLRPKILGKIKNIFIGFVCSENISFHRLFQAATSSLLGDGSTVFRTNLLIA